MKQQLTKQNSTAQNFYICKIYGVMDFGALQFAFFAQSYAFFFFRCVFVGSDSNKCETMHESMVCPPLKKINKHSLIHTQMIKSDTQSTTKKLMCLAYYAGKRWWWWWHSREKMDKRNSQSPQCYHFLKLHHTKPHRQQWKWNRLFFFRYFSTKRWIVAINLPLFLSVCLLVPVSVFSIYNYGLSELQYSNMRAKQMNECMRLTAENNKIKRPKITEQWKRHWNYMHIEYSLFFFRELVWEMQNW